MKYYAGLDVAMKETYVCILREDGKKVYEGKCFSHPDDIYDCLKKGKVPLETIGLETGSLSRYLAKALRALDCPVVCIDSRKMAAILAVTINKTDKNDARGIADAMRCNHYKESQIKDDDKAAMDILLNSRTTLVNSLRTLKNTVRGHLKNFGIRLGSVSNKKFCEVVEIYVLNLEGPAKDGIEGLLKSYKAIHNEIAIVEKKLKSYCSLDQDVKLLMTAPGVGKVTAMTYKTVIGDPSRFEKSRSVGAYFGMSPRQYSSGETIRQGPISRCSSKGMRTLLAEAAIVLLTRTKALTPLKVWGLKLMKKNGLKKAAMAVGRKLSIILHRILITRKPFINPFDSRVSEI